MRIFLDTASIEEINHINKWGIIEGITTNQKIFLVEKGTSFKKRIKEIIAATKGPVSVELTTKGFDEMVQEAREYWRINPRRIVIKVPMSADGVGLEVISFLAKRGIKINTTVMMNSAQAILAAKAGSTYVSLFYRRILDSGGDPLKEIRETREFLDSSKLITQIIAGSIREADDVVKSFNAGAHIVTVPYKVLIQMPYHKKSEETIKEFDESWHKFTKSPEVITVRVPLRITLGGGGTDLPFYASKHSGFLIAAAIDKYIHVSINRSYTGSNVVRYEEEIEAAKNKEDLNHAIVREALKHFKVADPVSITITSAFPAGTGMGSSSAVTVGLIKGLSEFTGTYNNINKQKIAELAAHIERGILKEEGGKQDQYITAYGGIQEMIFGQDGSVQIQEIQLIDENKLRLENNLALFFLGTARSSSEIQKKVAAEENLEEKIESLNFIKELGFRVRKALIEGNIDDIGLTWGLHWEAKKKLASEITNKRVDNFYKLAKENGSLGGKIVGAGSGGFLIFYTKEKNRLIRRLEKEGLKYIPFRFSTSGVSIIHND